MTNLSWPLRRAVRLHADKEAVVAGHHRLTYAELCRRVDGLGSGLTELGLPGGAHVGVLAENSLAHLECWLGLPAAGFVICDLNFRLAEDELALITDDCALRVLIVDDAQMETGRALLARCRALEQLVYAGGGACPSDCIPYERLIAAEPQPRAEPHENDLAAISYTGGTTGTPKGVMLTHRNLVANAHHNLQATRHGPEDRFLHVCPMFHVAGTANLYAATWAGASQIVLPRFDPQAVAVAIAAERVTKTVLVPTMLSALLECLAMAPADLSSLREIGYAASPISPELQRRVLATLACDLSQFYGMTEAAPTVSHCTPEDHRRGAAGEHPYVRRLGSIGAPVPGVEAVVCAPDGAQLGLGEIGELRVRGPNVTSGYWRRPDETASVFVDGWYRTGDAAYTDDDGYLYLVDRLKDMIITGGENVYSVEVEAVLLEHEDVLEAAVFGIPDPHWGEAVHAVITVAPGARVDEAGLIDHCRRHIAGFKLPRSLEISMDPLPKSGAGKLLKHKLREPYWIGQDRRIS